jgi:hypothetical protein
MRLSAPLYRFDQKDSSLKVVPLQPDPIYSIYFLFSVAWRQESTAKRMKLIPRRASNVGYL